MITALLPAPTPSWHCGVPVGRWRRVVTAQGEAALRVEYEPWEFGYGMALAYEQGEDGELHYRMPLLVAAWALELGERGAGA